MAAVVEFGLRKWSPSVNLRDLHPETRERCRDLFDLTDESGLSPLVIVNSGARSYAHQKRLYRAYVARGYTHPVVANPDAGLGSKHQVRPASYKHGNLPNRIDAAYAVDLKFADGHFPSAAEREILTGLAKKVGMRKSVPTEWWHFEPYKGVQVRSLLGIGYTGGDVTRLQTMLNNVDYAGLATDGVFGPATYRAVGSWQQRTGLRVTGDWTHTDQQRLLKQAQKQKISSPDVPGFDGINPTEYRTFREARQRFIQIRALLQTSNAENGARARQLADEGAKLIFHEQND